MIQRPLFTTLPPDSWCHWFAGLTDGEGHFQIWIGRQTGRPKLQMGVRFKLQLREDDKAILEEIRDYLSIGSLNKYNHSRQRSRGSYTMDSIDFKVTRINQIMHTLIPLFDKFPLRTKKQEDYHIWREAAKLVSTKQHMTYLGRMKYLDLYIALIETRNKQRAKYGWKPLNNARRVRILELMQADSILLRH